MFVVTFTSTHHAMFAEQMLKKAGFKIMTIPTPRQIDKSCRISLKINGNLIKEVIEVLEKYKIETKGIYEITYEGNVIVHYPR